MASVSAFRQQIRTGLQRQNRFRVMVQFPEFAGGSDLTGATAMLARTTQTPASTVGVIELGWGGRIIPLPGDRTYADFQVTFLATNDHKILDGFEAWHNGMNSHDMNRTLSNLDDFMRDVQLDLMNQNDDVVKSYILRDAFPVSIEGISLDQGAQDSFGEFTVTFRYVSMSSNTTD